MHTRPLWIWDLNFLFFQSSAIWQKWNLIFCLHSEIIFCLTWLKSDYLSYCIAFLSVQTCLAILFQPLSSASHFYLQNSSVEGCCYFFHTILCKLWRLLETLQLNQPVQHQQPCYSQSRWNQIYTQECALFFYLFFPFLFFLNLVLN